MRVSNAQVISASGFDDDAPWQRAMFQLIKIGTYRAQYSVVPELWHPVALGTCPNPTGALGNATINEFFIETHTDSPALRGRAVSARLCPQLSLVFLSAHPAGAAMVAVWALDPQYVVAREGMASFASVPERHDSSLLTFPGGAAMLLSGRPRCPDHISKSKVIRVSVRLRLPRERLVAELQSSENAAKQENDIP
jgi:hypothetical protein